MFFLKKIPLQTEKNGYYCFLIFKYIKCELKKINSCLSAIQKAEFGRLFVIQLASQL